MDGGRLAPAGGGVAAGESEVQPPQAVRAPRVRVISAQVVHQGEPGKLILNACVFRVFPGARLAACTIPHSWPLSRGGGTLDASVRPGGGVWGWMGSKLAESGLPRASEDRTLYALCMGLFE